MARFKKRRGETTETTSQEIFHLHSLQMWHPCYEPTIHDLQWENLCYTSMEALIKEKKYLASNLALETGYQITNLFTFVDIRE